jgi:hypothetical protein
MSRLCCVHLSAIYPFRVHRILSALGLTHFLCYGSLWGQIRISRSLPWEADVEFCLLNEELTKYDEVFLVRTFKIQSLQLTYNSGEGVYTVKDPTFGGASVQLIVFEEDPLVIYYCCILWNADVLKGKPDLQWKILSVPYFLFTPLSWTLWFDFCKTLQFI